MRNIKINKNFETILRDGERERMGKQRVREIEIHRERERERERERRREREKKRYGDLFEARLGEGRDLYKIS